MLCNNVVGEVVLMEVLCLVFGYVLVWVFKIYRMVVVGDVDVVFRYVLEIV